MNLFLVLILYNLLLPVVLIVGLPKYLKKAIQRGNVKRNFLQRLGFYSRETRQALARKGNLWIHAVSVGEVLVALKVIRAIRQREPDRPIVLSTTTPTGFALAEKEKVEGMTVIYNPADLPWTTWAVTRRIRPQAILLVEAEVWPNLVAVARALKVPVFLINARLSRRSERRFRRFSFMTRPIFQLLEAVCVQYEGETSRWEGLGVTAARIHCLGSVKYDDEGAAPPLQQIEELREALAAARPKEAASGPILLAGSTHPGEEAFVGQVYLKLREEFPDLYYIAVPRHAERGRQVSTELHDAGLLPNFRIPLTGETNESGNSNGNGLHGHPPESNNGPVWETSPPSLSPVVPSPVTGSERKAPCLVVNTTGELRAWYYLADLVVIGKSFLGEGGQNPVEAIVAGKPVIFGPHMENFTTLVTGILDGNGARQATGEAELLQISRELLRNPTRASQLAENGKRVLECHNGSAARTAELVLNRFKG